MWWRRRKQGGRRGRPKRPEGAGGAGERVLHWPEEPRLTWEGEQAFQVFDGGMPRDESEKAAYDILCQGRQDEPC